MSHAPAQLKYAASHEWSLLGGDGVVTVGITDYAQNSLGDVVFVELPEVGRMVKQTEQIAVVESVKAASDIYAPVSGTVVAVNELLTDSPETINESPYDKGWFFKIKAADTKELNGLMSAADYSASCENS